MPKDTVQQFAARIKAKFPEYGGRDDRDLVTRWVQKFPEYQDKVDLSGDPTFGDSLITGGLRVGGAITGGVLGLGGGPVGAAAGGALGSAAGEGLAEVYEKVRGLRSEMNPLQIAVQGGLGAIPVPGVGPGASIAKAALGHGLQGAGLGAASTVATSLAEDGQLPSLGQVATAAGAGGLLGGGIGAFAARPGVARTPSVIPEFETLATARETAGKPAAFGDRMQAVLTEARKRYIDRSTQVAGDVKAGEKAAGITLSPDANPHSVMAVEAGGGGGRVAAAMREYDALIKEAEKLGVTQAVDDYVQVHGFRHTDRALKDKATKLLMSSDPALVKEGEELRDRIFGRLFPFQPGNTHLPESLHLPRLDQILTDLQTTHSNQWGDITRLGDQIFDRQRGALDMLKNEGIISDDLHTELIGRGHDYVPLHRIVDRPDGMGKVATYDLPAQHVIKERWGSTKANINVIQAAAAREAEALKEVSRNRMGRSYVQLAQINPVWANHIAELRTGQTPRVGYGTISYLEGGAKKTFEVPEAIAAVYKRTSDSSTLPLEGLFGATRSVAQSFMTALNPAFSIFNALGDIQDARKLMPGSKQFNVIHPDTWIAGPKDFGKFMKAWGKAFKSVWKEDASFARFQNAGGDFSTLQHQITPELFDGKPKGTLYEKTFGKIAKFSATTENATKLASFNRAIEGGASDFEGALNARRFGGSPDFAVKGDRGSTANLLFMFFNAQAQGTARNVRFLLGSPMKAVSMAAGATVYAGALYGWNQQFIDPDGVRSLDRVSDQEKQTNWIVMRPATYTTSEGTVRHQYFKIKKGHINRLIYNPIEESVEWGAKTLRGEPTTNSGTQVGLDVASNILPGSINLKEGDILGSLARGTISSLNPLIKIPYEWRANEDTYRGIPIEAKRLEGVTTTQRKTATTSPTMGAASKMLDQVGLAEPLGASPVKLQHALASIAPGLGEAGLGILDVATGKPSQVKLEGDERMSRMPIAGPLLRRVWGSPLDQVENEQLRQFYDLQQAADEATKTYKLLVARSPQEAQEFIQDPENQRLVGMNGPLVKWSKQLAQLRRQKEQIMFNPSDTQGEQLKAIGRAETQVLGQIGQALTQLGVK